MTGYPNREHEEAIGSARRRALQALADIEREVAFLRAAVAVADSDAASTLVQRTADVVRHLSALETLRDSRKRVAAGTAGTAEGAAR